MTNLDHIIDDLGPEEHKILMEKLQKDEIGEWKNTIDPIWVSFFNFINNVLKMIRRHVSNNLLIHIYLMFYKDQQLRKGVLF